MSLPTLPFTRLVFRRLRFLIHSFPVVILISFTRRFNTESGKSKYTKYPAIHQARPLFLAPVLVHALHRVALRLRQQASGAVRPCGAIPPTRFARGPLPLTEPRAATPSGGLPPSGCGAARCISATIPPSFSLLTRNLSVRTALEGCFCGKVHLEKEGFIGVGLRSCIPRLSSRTVPPLQKRVASKCLKINENVNLKCKKPHFEFTMLLDISKILATRFQSLEHSHCVLKVEVYSGGAEVKIQPTLGTSGPGIRDS